MITARLALSSQGRGPRAAESVDFVQLVAPQMYGQPDCVTNWLTLDMTINWAMPMHNAIAVL